MAENVSVFFLPVAELRQKGAEEQIMGVVFFSGGLD